MGLLMDGPPLPQPQAECHLPRLWDGQTHAPAQEWAKQLRKAAGGI